MAFAIESLFCEYLLHILHTLVNNIKPSINPKKTPIKQYIHILWHDIAMSVFFVKIIVPQMQ